ncbi:hypothetical protein ABVT39_012147 [Epinephelus coioides]
MNNRLDQRGGGGGAGAGVGGGGRGEREFFLSTHRCPEVDLLPHHSCQTQIPPPCSVVPAETSCDVTCRGQSEENYLDISSTCHSKEEEEEEKEVKVEEDEEGSVSDWSEEDLSLHFSPSVILPSDEEESDPESGFECIDVTMETQVKGSEGEGQKMVPKRLIQLKKKNNNAENNTEKLQVILKDGSAEGGGAYSEVSANELLCPTIHRCPDLLLRQHSMPASLHTHSTTSSDVESYRVYRGLVGGASPGVTAASSSAEDGPSTAAPRPARKRRAKEMHSEMMEEFNRAEDAHQERENATLERWMGMQQEAEERRFRMLQEQQATTNGMFMNIMQTFMQSMSQQPPQPAASWGPLYPPQQPLYHPPPPPPRVSGWSAQQSHPPHPPTRAHTPNLLEQSRDLLYGDGESEDRICCRRCWNVGAEAATAEVILFG